MNISWYKYDKYEHNYVSVVLCNMIEWSYSPDVEEVAILNQRSDSAAGEVVQPQIDGGERVLACIHTKKSGIGTEDVDNGLRDSAGLHATKGW